MKRAAVVLLVSLCYRPASGQYPIYPAMPQQMTWPASAVYQPGIYSGYSNPAYASSGFSPYGYGSYGSYGFGAVPYGGMNWLPPTLPSPYFVVPSGRQYLEQVRRREQATYSQLKLLNSSQK